MKKFIFSVSLLFFSSFGSAKDGLTSAEKLWKNVAVQYQGRVKPFDTFSRELLQAVYGKQSYKGKSAVEVVLLWLIVPDVWSQIPIVYVEGDLKKQLGLPVKQKYFSIKELSFNQKLSLQLAELTALKQKEEDLDSYFKDLQRLETRLILFSALQTGFLLKLEPSQNKDLWLSLGELSPKVNKEFKTLITLYSGLISKNILKEDTPLKQVKKPKLYPAFLKNSFNKESEQEIFSKFKDSMMQFQSLLNLSPKVSSKIKAEVFYNSYKPISKACFLYFLFLISFAFMYFLKKEKFFKYSLPLVGFAFFFHALDLMFRSYIMSRPPVSNMYETVVWVPFVSVIAGFVFYLRGNRWPFLGSSFLAFFCLLLIHVSGDILDSSLQPLEAVLRSNFWLIVHVLTITMSYSFFFLAFVLGDIALISYLKTKDKPLYFVKKMYQPIYRLIQWGVVFLAGGTLLGAVWADYSWGRFWGWDPKESWALISLLAYLALLHGKLVGWIQALNMAVSSVLMFFLVVMAWYGVNFVLGKGLHSYGFGSGGVEYVLGFFVLHLILCGFVFAKKYFWLSSK